jgi:hypothetical protein
LRDEGAPKDPENVSSAMLIRGVLTTTIAQTEVHCFDLKRIFVANTHPIKTEIEPYVRDWLAEKFGISFHKKFVQLAECEGLHEFDAVSADRRIVAGIKSSSAKTSGEKNPSGKIASAFQELYFLVLVKAEIKILVLTDRDFFDLLIKRTRNKLPSNIQLLYCPLSVELDSLVRSITFEASDEIDRGKKVFGKATGR